MGFRTVRAALWPAAAIVLFSIAAPAGAREVSVEFTFNRVRRIASNQVAVWVEDAAGRHVKTLFATRFTSGKRGYRRRNAALPDWVRAFAPDSRSDAEIDAVSRATPANGRVRILWDCTDEQGRPVDSGRYTVQIEGNIFWENEVRYSASVDVGGEDSSVEPLPFYNSKEGEADMRLLSDVEVVYRS